jgi:glucose/arabinose dehydrogenase/PKD repeat protein
MRSMRRSSSRQGSFAGLVSLVMLGSLLLQVTAAAPVQAGQPEATRCEKGFLRSQAPDVAGDCATVNGGGTATLAATVPAGFQESIVWSGLVNPSAIRFAADGRVFVAEKSGVIKVFDSLADPTPTSFSNLVTNVHDFWDRGLLGLALDPSLTGGTGTGSYVYVLYAYDHILGSGASAPRWGDTCPTPPGATTDGCVISGRLSRFGVSGSTILGPEQVLVEDWCQQFPSHSIGSLVFGPDGALYVSAGDGASFNGVDYGQLGGTSGTPPVTPINPCGDPPGGAMSPPSAEGGALRSQDVRTGGAVSSYASLVAADGAVAYWRFGETGTTVAADSRGTNTGTYTGGYTQGTTGALSGDANTAVTLNGTTGFVAVPDSNSLDLGNGPLSYEVWAKRADQGTYYQLLYTKASQGNLFFLNGKFTLDNDATTIVQESGTTADTNWHHFVVTRSGSGSGNTRLYKDGIDVTTEVNTSVSLSTNSSALAIGRYNPTYGLYFPGSLDEIAVYSSALSPAQVSAHYAAATTPAGGEPTGLDGAILRLDPATGAGMPGNPFSASADSNARRIIAYGLRNPFRITTRPGTNEVWVGDVGWNTWEEINRIPNATDAIAENFGWPCYEGNAMQGGYDGSNLSLCESLYSQGPGAIAAPIFTYNHAATVVPNETCPVGSSSITGLAFYPETSGSFPVAYRGGLFFADYSRNCIWFMPKGANGQPNPAAVQTFVAGAANPVDLVIGPNGDLFYPDFGGGTIRRITSTGGNQAPTAVIQASPTSGPAPLTVQFSGSGSSDPEGTPLTYQWDLDGDGQYDDATGVTTSRTYQSPGNVTVGLKVTDAGSATGTASQVISVSNSPPVPVIATPSASLTWKVGDTISFSGSATDAQDGTLPASGLSWTLVLQHCPSNCHSHVIQTWSGVSSGSFSAPDHEYPSYLELTLTATDSFGTTASTTVRLDPRTVVLTFQTTPVGLSLAVNQTTSSAPFTRTVIVGSSNSVTAPSPQTLSGLSYGFVSWSDGLAQSHQIVAPTVNTTYTATYQTTSLSFTPDGDALIRWNKATTNFGTTTGLQVRSGQYRSYLKFTVNGLSGAASSAKLRLWVTAASTNGGSVYPVSNSWTETGITWSNAPAISGSPLSSVGTATAGTWVEFNLGSVITGNGTYSFAISGGTSDSVIYASRETASDPVLIVTP